MGLRTPRFRYPLQVLLIKHTWDVETLALELAAARRALAGHEAELARLRLALRAIDSSLCAMRTGGATLDLGRQQVLIDYRAAQEEAIALEEAQAKAATQLCEQINEQLVRARKALDGLESHSSRLSHAHAREAGNAAAKEADDAWLLRQRWLEAQP